MSTPNKVGYVNAKTLGPHIEHGVAILSHVLRDGTEVITLDCVDCDTEIVEVLA